MTVTDNPNVIRAPELTAVGETIVRQIDGVGELVFHDYPAGSWMTKKGTPAKTARREYLLDGKELDSVSSIVDALRKIGLEFWKEDMGARGAVQLERMGELVGVPEEDIVRKVRQFKLGADARAAEAAARGSAIHAVFHGLATGGTAPNPAEFPVTARNWLRGAMRAWRALKWSETVQAEDMVCHPELLFAGRPDLVAVCDGKVTLIDYKTSGKGEVYDSVHWQLRLYWMALLVMGVPVERAVAVGIGDDGGFELIECEATEEWARALVLVFRAGKRINAGMGSQRRARVWEAA